MRQNPISSNDMKDFILCYRANNIAKRRETPVFRRFTYEDIVARDKANLDIHWKQAEVAMGDSPSPQVLMQEILKDLEEAMKQFAAAESELHK